MDHIEKYAKHLEETLPEIVDTQKLIDIGIYSSAQAAAYARRLGTAIEWFKAPGGGVRYLKSAVIEAVRKGKDLKKPSGANLKKVKDD